MMPKTKAGCKCTVCETVRRFKERRTNAYYASKWIRNNPEKAAEYIKRSAENRKNCPKKMETEILRRKRYREKNKSRISETRKKKYKENPEPAKLRNRNRIKGMSPIQKHIHDLNQAIRARNRRNAEILKQK